ncbi:hypothetical protein LTR70_009949 [Exophiala xenobiotica]|uniref:NAD(P)-binding protein n=1 Tax=Lithohypha guttulata TaxID=1690604 RepID=A0ABR0JVU4_9EURO|nr:hypothetical protein LTR24_009823 [Lithohypha guttulata]KAK5309831.1 hypothetical protein LTR70_009949 [Exophiala xenobiotica]
MSFPYKKVAVFGATSGIGKALAKRFIANGIFVIAIARRKERLAELVHQYGHDKVEASPFDITMLGSIPNYVTNLTSSHPDLDLVFLNSGIQRPVDFTKPDSVDLDVIQEEFLTNYLSPVAFTKAFLPHLLSRAKDSKTAGILYTTSGLALTPIRTVPNYCATKAAMHSMILTLRDQLADTGVKVLELYPPAVQTELHGENGKHIGMPLDEFTNDAWKGLSEGKDQVPVGTAVKAFEGFEKKRQEMYQGMAQMVKNGTPPPGSGT